jgi:nucleoside triphosphate pyrophosphatase
VEPRIVLASASPRRAHILRSLGVPFRVRVAGVDEDLEPGEAASAAADRLARKKALSVAALEALLPVLAADTLVVCDEEALGKPASEDDAARMLRRLAGRDHEVVTGVCVANAGRVRAGIERSVVRFAALRDDEIAAYVASGEPMDKAGAYHIDGRGALFVESVAGSPSNVAGLPVRLVARLCAEAGVRLFP